MQTRARARQLSSSFVQITGDDVDFFHISFFCKFSFTFRFSWALALILLLSIRWVGCCVLACDEFGFAICQTHYLSCFRLPALLHRLKKYLNFKSGDELIFVIHFDWRFADSAARPFLLCLMGKKFINFKLTLPNSFHPVWPDKNRQMPIKVAQKWFH